MPWRTRPWAPVSPSVQLAWDSGAFLPRQSPAARWRVGVQGLEAQRNSLHSLALLSFPRSLLTPKLVSSCMALPLKHHLAPTLVGFFCCCFFLTLTKRSSISPCASQISSQKSLENEIRSSVSRVCLNSPSGNPGFKRKEKLKTDPNKLCANIMKLLCLPAGGHSLSQSK